METTKTTKTNKTTTKTIKTINIQKDGKSKNITPEGFIYNIYHPEPANKNKESTQGTLNELDRTILHEKTNIKKVPGEIKWFDFMEDIDITTLDKYTSKEKEDVKITLNNALQMREKINQNENIKLKKKVTIQKIDQKSSSSSSSSIEDLLDQQISFDPPYSLDNIPDEAKEDMFFYMPYKFKQIIDEHIYIDNVKLTYQPLTFISKEDLPFLSLESFKEEARKAGLYVIRDESIGNEYCIIHCKFLELYESDLKIEIEENKVVPSNISNEDDIDFTIEENLTSLIEDIIRIFILLEYKKVKSNTFGINNKVDKTLLRYGLIILSTVTST